jgi:hypothetical protein
LDYFLARYYSAAQGRFVSADRTFASQRTPDPQSWNLFAFSRNNPLLYVDLSGEDYDLYDSKGKFIGRVKDATDLERLGYIAYAGSEDGTLLYFKDKKGNLYTARYVEGDPGRATQVYSGLGLTAFARGVLDQLSRSSKGSLQLIGALWGGSVIVGATAGVGIYAISGTTVGLDAFSLTGPPRGLQLLLRASNGKLRNIIKALYRVTARLGDGGTASSIEYTAETGELVGGSTHVQKGLDLIKGLGNVLRDPNLSQADREIATALLNELKRALSKVP